MFLLLLRLLFANSPKRWHLEGTKRQLGPVLVHRLDLLLKEVPNELISMITDPGVDILIVVDRLGPLDLALRGYFVGDGLELLHHQEDLEVASGIELLTCVAVPQLEGPLLHVEYPRAETAELEVAEVFAEIIDAFFSEQGLYEVEPIAQRNEWYVFHHEKFHRTDIGFGKSLIEVGAGLEEERNQRFQLLLL